MLAGICPSDELLFKNLSGLEDAFCINPEGPAESSL